MEVSSSRFCWKSFIRTFSASLKVTSLHEYKANGQPKRKDFLTRCSLSCSICSDCSGFFHGDQFVIIPSLEPRSGFRENYHCKWGGTVESTLPPVQLKTLQRRPRHMQQRSSIATFHRQVATCNAAVQDAKIQHQYASVYISVYSFRILYSLFGIQCMSRSNKPVTIFKIIPNISLPSACFRHSLTIPQAATAVIHRSARGQARPRIHWMPWLRTPGFFSGEWFESITVVHIYDINKLIISIHNTVRRNDPKWPAQRSPKANLGKLTSEATKSHHPLFMFWLCSEPTLSSLVTSAKRRRFFTMVHESCAKNSGAVPGKLLNTIQCL